MGAEHPWVMPWRRQSLGQERGLKLVGQSQGSGVLGCWGGGTRQPRCRLSPKLPTGAGLVPERAAPGAGEAGRLADPHPRRPVRHPHPQLRPQRQLPPQAGRMGSHPSWWAGGGRGVCMGTFCRAGSGDGWMDGRMGQCWGTAGHSQVLALVGIALWVLWGPLQEPQGGMGVAEPLRELPVTPAGQPAGMGPWGPGWVPLTKPVPSVSPGAGRAAGQVLVRGPQDRGEAAGFPGAEGGLGLSPAGGQHVSVTAAAPRCATARTPTGAA